MTNDQLWQVAINNERSALNHLSKITNKSGQISHAQAEAVLLEFLLKSKFKELAKKFINMKEEKGWTYTERT